MTGRAAAPELPAGLAPLDRPGVPRLGDGLRGHVVAYRSGHPHNIELVRLLAQQMPAKQVLPRQRLMAA